MSDGSFSTRTPPLTIERTELDRALDILDDALQEVETGTTTRID